MFASYASERKDSRARSIKTRIETQGGHNLVQVGDQIREQDPLKQGLKPTSLSAGITLF